MTHDRLFPRLRPFGWLVALALLLPGAPAAQQVINGVPVGPDGEPTVPAGVRPLAAGRDVAYSDLRSAGYFNRVCLENKSAAFNPDRTPCANFFQTMNNGFVAVWLRRRRTQSFWPYVLGPGALSWAALYFGGLHPALALVPVVPFMPHSPRDLGLFESTEEHRPDTLSRFEHWWAVPVQIVLLLFGFANAGVPVEQVGPGTYYVLAGLLFGKPIGILLFSTLARFAGASLPTGLRMGDLLVVGVVASIGFTVSLFFATAAFPAGIALAETKMGALLSFVAAPLALVVSRVARGRQSVRQAANRDGV